MKRPGNLATVSQAITEERTYVRGVACSYTDAYFNSYVLIRTRVGSSWSDFMVAHLGLDGHEEPLYPAISGPEQTYASVDLALGAISAHWASWEAREVSRDRRFVDEIAGATDRETYDRHHQLRRMRRSDSPPDGRTRSELEDGGAQAIARWLDDGGASRSRSAEARAD